MTNPLQQGKQQRQKKTLKKSAFFEDHRGKRGSPLTIPNDDRDHDIDFGSWDHHPSLYEKKSEDIND